MARDRQCDRAFKDVLQKLRKHKKVKQTVTIFGVPMGER